MEVDQISALARLSRLELSAEERSRASRQIEALLGHFEALSDLDLTGVEPSIYPRPISLTPRDDEPESPLPQDQVLANAPQTRSDQFSVPKVIEG